MSYYLGLRSRWNLRGVKDPLVAVVKRAIQLVSVDFTVTEGVRSLARQKVLVAAGASQTLNSRHITGNAVDLAPYVGGRIRWDWPLFYPLAEAMRQAAWDEGVNIRWGGCWHLYLNNTSPSQSTEALERTYHQYCIDQKKKPFSDGPHFELPA